MRRPCGATSSFYFSKNLPMTSGSYKCRYCLQEHCSDDTEIWCSVAFYDFYNRIHNLNPSITYEYILDNWRSKKPLDQVIRDYHA